ncbi:NAD(P)-binding protein [Apiospora sp. TS-2023a]
MGSVDIASLLEWIRGYQRQGSPRHRRRRLLVSRNKAKVDLVITEIAATRPGVRVTVWIASFAIQPGDILESNLASHLILDEFGCIEEISRRNNGRVTFAMGHAFKTISQVTAPLLAACLDPALEVHSGSFVQDCKVGQALEYATDSENAQRLWALSEQLVGQVFDV